MKLLENTGAVVSAILVAVGFFWLTRPGLFATGQILAILGLLSAVTLSFGLYIFHLRGRVAAVGKQLRDRQ